MVAPTQTQFRPNYTQPPGEYLREVLEDRGIKIVDFAVRCGRPTKTVSEILSSDTAITPETALQFEFVLGISASLWLSLESQHQLALVKQRRARSLDDDLEWAESFPISEMQEKGYIPKYSAREDGVDVMLGYFGVSSPDAWTGFWNQKVSTARFKQTANQKINNYAVSAWLRKGDVEASNVSCEIYNEAKFRGALMEARSLSIGRWPSYKDTLISLFSNAGVALVFVRDLSKTCLRGAAYWATKDKAVIIVSDRMKNERAFWFALFHEAAHILLHSKKALFLDLEADKGGSVEEKEADETAANMLISREQLDSFFEKYGRRKDYSATVLKSYATEIGISAALLFGRLQFEKVLPYAHRLSSTFHQRMDFD